MDGMVRSVSVATGLVLASAGLWATPATAQLVNFPVYATPSAYGAPGTFIAAGYGRGLNEDSGKQNAYGAAVGRTGLGERVSIFAAGAMVDLDPDSKFTFGAGVGVDVLPADATTQVSVQGGIGFMSVDPLTYMNFPVGVAIKTMLEAGTSGVELWAMPRLNIARVSNGTSVTETDFGASAGAGVTTASGFGFHAAIDLVAADQSVWVGGIGVHYVIQ